MTVVQLLSDLHLEFHADGGQAFLESLDPSGVDVLVVAGDLHSDQRGLVNSLLSFCSVYPQVIFVCGNHDFYGSSPTQIHALLYDLDQDINNFHWLHNSTIELNGVRFAGTPLWFPKPTDPLVMVDRFHINDFHLIKDFEPWVYDEHYKAMKFLREEGPKADAIVTHHVPSALCASPRFKTSSINHYFVTDLTNEIYRWRPKAWLCGHSHDRTHRRIGRTLMACNPLGYPQEEGPHVRGHYAEKCLIEVNYDGAAFVNDRPGEPYHHKPTLVGY